ncbi:MAG: HAD-IA family hydrolase [Clostridia bacterium]|nr:HAD-IA family hydrolase [Clostridia bacterium]
MLINGYWGEEDRSDLVTVSCGHIYTFQGREINRPTGRPDYLLLYIHRGSVCFFLHGREVQARSGDFILYAPGEEQHHIYTSNRSGEFYYLHFTTEQPQDLETLGMTSSVLYHSTPSAETADTFEQIIRELQTRREGYRTACRLLARFLFLCVHRQLKGAETTREAPELIAVIQYIRRHYMENTSLEEYAEMCRMSKYHFSRLFKKQTGMSPMEYRASVRMEHAKELLTSTRLSIKKIAELAGYSSQEYFSDAFKKQNGCSPSRYREKENLMKPMHLFDFDGTLADSMPVWARTMLSIIEEAGVPYPADIIRIITPLGYEGTADYFISLGVKTPKEELIATMFSRAEKAYAEEIVLKPGVAAYIKKLTAAGCSCNVLTASPHRCVDPCLKRNGIYDLFDRVWTLEDFSLTKGEPAIYHQAAERLGTTAADLCFYDDNLVALTAGKKSGMETVGVYDPCSDDYRREIEELTDRYIESFEELL